MPAQLIAQFSENGEPVIPPEWGAVPEFDTLAKLHDRGYLRVIVLLCAYRSPYRKPARKLSYSDRVKLLFDEWPRRWGTGFRPKIEVLATDVYRAAEVTFRKALYDPLWERLLILENKETEINSAINSLSFTFSGDGLDAEVIQAERFEDELDEEEDFYAEPEETPKRGKAKAEKARKPEALVAAEILKKQSESLKALMDAQVQVSQQAELLRGQLWREIKSNRETRATDIMELI